MMPAAWGSASSRVPDLAIDLGTANLRVVSRAGEIVADVPSVVALERSSQGDVVVAWGEAAAERTGRTSRTTRVVHPIQGGAVVDYDACERLLRAVLHPWAQRRWRGPTVLVMVNPQANDMERRAVQSCVRAAGASEAWVAPSLVASALGAGAPVREARGSLVVDVGAGRTDVAVVSHGGVVVRRSVRVAGDAMDEGIVRWVKRHHQVLVTRADARRFKHLRSRLAAGEGQELHISGRDLRTGAATSVAYDPRLVDASVTPPMEAIRDAVAEALRQVPPEIAGDILERGALVTGGAARSFGLPQALRDATGTPCFVSEQPDHATAKGAATLLRDAALLWRTVGIA